MPWLTPSTLPDPTLRRVLSIPDSVDWLAIVSGALLELAQADNWQQYGALTENECADAMQIMFDAFSLDPVTSSHMIGELITFAGATNPLPDQWLACDGASLLRADYPDLFDCIGVVYGSADSAHFNVPDLRGRSSLGAGQGAGLTNRVLGVANGEEAHQLITAEMPAHTHNVLPYSAAGTGPSVGAPIRYDLAPATLASGSAGSDGAHNNMPPFLAVNYFIVAN
jgi:microcystin-dependent protein